ncbi:MAG: hypothetical protein JXB14_02525 [Candidatus Altiarchaeota archaeon]|nr:hypothetical protein [Candidatus Altiarchaeota archaeon]
MKRPVPEYVKCPKCGKELEIWSDELGVECECGNKVSRDVESCIKWCDHARECLGEEKYNELVKKQKDFK